MNGKIPSDIVWSVVASAGGIAKYLHLYIIHKERFTIPELLARAVVSGFSGYMFAHAMMLVKPDWALVTAGVGGYIGAEAMDYLVALVGKRFGK